MKLQMYQIDAFTNNIFEGNPAAVCPLDEWLSDDLMLKIANENNLSETAFFVKEKDFYRIRWFTPISEVDMCGHATLASAYVIFKVLNYKDDTIIFNSKSGILKVKNIDNKFEMDFPIQTIQKCNTPNIIIKAFNKIPLECYKSMDYIVVFKYESDIVNLEPNFEMLKELDLRGVIVTVQSKSYDFITRCFFPKYGVNEDPVTGSAFTQLVPYWSKKFNKDMFRAKQISKRGGEVFCKLDDNRIKISGYAVKYLDGIIDI